MVPAGNKAKRLSSVNHTTKAIHHHHHHRISDKGLADVVGIYTHIILFKAKKSNSSRIWKEDGPSSTPIP